MSFSPLSLSVLLLGVIFFTTLVVYLWWRQQSIPVKQFKTIQDEHFRQKAQLEGLLAERDHLVAELQRLRQDQTTLQTEKEKWRGEYLEVNQRAFYLDASVQREKEIAETRGKELDLLSAQVIELNRELSVANASLEHAQQRLKTQMEDFVSLREKSVLEFKNTANTLLEEKSARFTQMNKENIQQILGPLGENLAEFKKKVEETATQGTIQSTSLENRIKELVELNYRISEEATNLTNALKGQAKTRGDWGEMILENILEYSGLTRNREYFVQDSFRDDQGQVKRPDIIVKYPDQRYIVIDSKVSLVAYERMNKAEQGPAFDLELAAHIKSLRNHIDELSAKEYDKLDKTLDFVMLFVPIEPAYLAAMQHDPELWNYAYARRILLISPTNLIAALKMVADIWKRDDQNKNAREIAKRGEILYDKFVGFVSDLENIERYLVKADESYRDAMTKLKTGRGNLIGQAEKLKKLGIKSKKSLPESLLPDGDEEE